MLLSGPSMRTIQTRPVLILTAASLIVLVCASSLVIDLGQHVETARRLATELGPLAPGVYTGISVIATLVGMPSAPVAILAALLFGPLQATLVAVSANITSAVLAFLIARSVAGNHPGARWCGTQTVARLGRFIETRQPVAILLIRAIMPFTLVNYGLGLTGIPFWRYVLWSVLAIAPADALLVLWANGFYLALVDGRVVWMLASIAAAALLVTGAALLVRRSALVAGDERRRPRLTITPPPRRLAPSRHWARAKLTG